MNLQNTLSHETQSTFFQLVATLGLILNGLLLHAGMEQTVLQGLSVFIFGFGAIGFALMYAIPYAQNQSAVSPEAVVPGGIALGLVASISMGALVAQGLFNNLLAIMLLSGLAAVYVFMWTRFQDMTTSDLAFH